MSERRPPPRLLALTPGGLGGADPREGLDELERRIADAVRAGLEGVLLREPGLVDGPLFDLAQRLRARFEGLWIGLHDRPHLAAAAGADGVHLGFHSLPPERVRPWLDHRIALGVSTHAEDLARGPEPAEPGADYAFHGPVEATPKPVPREPVGREGLARFVAARGEDYPLGVWGLGGLGPEHAPAVLATGAGGLAVLRGVLAAASPAAATEAYLRALG